jgi:hypothetical protein
MGWFAQKSNWENGVSTAPEKNDTLLGLLPGDIVQVRNEPEILATLDGDGKLEGLPVADEMRPFYGGIFVVHKRADKTCVDGAHMRRMQNTVFLKNVRCNGAFHDGCDRLCAFFWKEAWLKPAPASTEPQTPSLHGLIITEPRIDEIDPLKKYSCQSTELVGATGPLAWWSLGQYASDMRGGQLSPLEFVQMLSVLGLNQVRRRLGMPDYAVLRGTNRRTPKKSLNLQPGERVRVRSKQEIRETLDIEGKNRGLEFSPEMVRMCGREFIVLKRCHRMIREDAGNMVALNDCVLLENGYCDGISHRGCKRENYYFCKEIWLERP